MKKQSKVEKAAEKYASGWWTRWEGDKLIGRTKDVDPDARDAFLAGAAWQHKQDVAAVKKHMGPHSTIGKQVIDAIRKAGK